MARPHFQTAPDCMGASSTISGGRNKTQRRGQGFPMRRSAAPAREQPTCHSLSASPARRHVTRFQWPYRPFTPLLLPLRSIPLPIA
ncbi:unnamed protein product [Rhizoctonia solani]|uniref:Uncharacterized protein n=1 Tax=Rhizoctonia solani TaxID=456999 RepID=A0A8H3BBD9_9AGAM|nr:unnamed protein product [Rhizoctonia solani]CAE6467457.1 unnamed protein product [Rhizoctonia solani]